MEQPPQWIARVWRAHARLGLGGYPTSSAGRVSRYRETPGNRGCWRSGTSA
jgi:hypothetical protein